eukprot:NODE_13672_length_253_cov_7.882353_g12759_i0.p3 GENE.NODE_13672_length_253_cov_7.882353_g12759_i0~~NODE_13672_length_253_cov_7.882353_g12759_i0.p3  ORF type:complete len:64 (-),score=30.41 NODE_13672_length_253_cov_7.882353_g12759_i0:61-225(-)
MGKVIRDKVEAYRSKILNARVAKKKEKRAEKLKLKAAEKPSKETPVAKKPAAKK